MNRTTGYASMLCLLVILLMGSASLPSRSYAGDMEILLDKLVSKGILTRSDADDVLKEIRDQKDLEQGKKDSEPARAGAKESVMKESETKEAPPEWARNIPGWIMNPPDWLKNITFSGDFRLRYDRLDREAPASSAANDIDRDRARFRLRLGIETEIMDRVDVGFGIASAENGNPRSNNQTFSSEWSKKSIWIDYAYAAYTPLPWLSFSGGKLKTNPFFRANSFGFPASGLLWDPDLTPEGVTMALKYPDLLRFEDGGLDVFVNNGFFILDEFSNGREPTMYGLQPGLNLQLMKRFNVKAALAYYHFFDIQEEPLLSNGPAPGHTNTAVAGRYRFNYNALSASGEMGYMAPFAPVVPYVGAFGEYVKNADGSHDQGWTAGVRLGYPVLAKFPDWQLSYAYRRMERDAWLDVFPDDDFYQGQTNSKGHYVSAALGIGKNISTELHWYRTSNISGEDQDEDRLLVHLLFKF